MTDSDVHELIRRRARELAAQAPTGWSPEQRLVLARVVLPRVQEVAA